MMMLAGNVPNDKTGTRMYSCAEDENSCSGSGREAEFQTLSLFGPVSFNWNDAKGIPLFSQWYFIPEKGPVRTCGSSYECLASNVKNTKEKNVLKINRTCTANVVMWEMFCSRRRKRLHPCIQKPIVSFEYSL